MRACMPWVRSVIRLLAGASWTDSSRRLGEAGKQCYFATSSFHLHELHAHRGDACTLAPVGVNAPLT
jgi:hypothetical protein